MENLAKKYKGLYLNAEAYIYMPELELIRKFIETIGNFANSVNEAFDSLVEAKNYMCIPHLQRMLADVCIKAYGLVYVNKDQTNAYINQFFTGKPKTISKNGYNVTSGSIKKVIEDKYPIVAEFYKEASTYVHFSNYYYHDFLVDSSAFDFSNLFSEESLADIFNNMVKLNETLKSIILEIMDKYAMRFPFRLDPNSGYLERLDYPITMIVTEEEGKEGLFMYTRISLNAAADYYEMLISTLQKVHEHQRRKAEVLGEDAYRVNVVAGALCQELNRIDPLREEMLKIMKEEGGEALANYSVLWMIFPLLWVDGIGDFIDRQQMRLPDMSKPDIQKDNMEELAPQVKKQLEEKGINLENAE